MKNGDKTPEFECEFNNTSILYRPSGRVEYILGNWDISPDFRVSACLEYGRKHTDDDKYYLLYHLYFENGKAYLRVTNVAKQYDNSVILNVVLSEKEIDILTAKTFSIITRHFQL